MELPPSQFPFSFFSSSAVLSVRHRGRSAHLSQKIELQHPGFPAPLRTSHSFCSSFFVVIANLLVAAASSLDLNPLPNEPQIDKH